MREDLELELERKYPFIKYTTFGIECDDGWYNIIDELCSKIDTILDNADPELRKEFMVIQIKEKYGTLRFYTGWATDEILDLIDEYELKSDSICEVCGKPGETKVVNQWYKTVCEDHYKEWLNRWDVNP